MYIYLRYNNKKNWNNNSYGLKIIKCGIVQEF